MNLPRYSPNFSLCPTMIRMMADMTGESRHTPFQSVFVMKSPEDWIGDDLMTGRVGVCVV